MTEKYFRPVLDWGQNNMSTKNEHHFTLLLLLLHLVPLPFTFSLLALTPNTITQVQWTYWSVVQCYVSIIHCDPISTLHKALNNSEHNKQWITLSGLYPEGDAAHNYWFSPERWEFLSNKVISYAPTIHKQTMQPLKYLSQRTRTTDSWNWYSEQFDQLDEHV